MLAQCCRLRSVLLKSVLGEWYNWETLEHLKFWCFYHGYGSSIFTFASETLFQRGKGGEMEVLLGD